MAAWQVERDGDRQVRADDGAQARQQFAFAVLAEIGHHGAVQSKQDAVDLADLLPRGVTDEAGNMIERRPRNACARRGVRRDHMTDIPSRLLSSVEKTGDLGIHVAEAADRRLSKVEAVGRKGGNLRPAFLERVAFMDEFGREDAEGHGYHPG